MGWTAFLTTPSGRAEYGSWSCTHNINGMIEDALTRAGRNPEDTVQPWWAKIREAQIGAVQNPEDFPLGRHSWWKLLDGRTGVEGHVLLTAVIEQLKADPEHYRAMNPANGWGDYDGLLKTLCAMRDAVPMEEPSVWGVWG